MITRFSRSNSSHLGWRLEESRIFILENKWWRNWSENRSLIPKDFAQPGVLSIYIWYHGQATFNNLHRGTSIYGDLFTFCIISSQNHRRNHWSNCVYAFVHLVSTLFILSRTVDFLDLNLYRVMLKALLEWNNLVRSYGLTWITL